MKKWKKQKKEIVEVLREEVKFQVSVSVNATIDQMNKLKDAIALDMKKWRSQRADLQIELTHISEKIDQSREFRKLKLGGGEPVSVRDGRFLSYKPFVQLTHQSKDSMN